ncbi:ABC transporter ATP-binding protein, partial [Bacillus licheniformis]|uniref:ABC transporter ATP-binding protein n=1 Tax=Bacillus licheniformis TaxID=1402 RepID=UPI00115F51DE
MVIATVLDLIRPYLLKVAVDDYITGYEKPMILTEADDYDLLFRGQKYLYVDPSENQSETYNLLVEGNEYYFGKTDSPKEKRTQIEESEYRMFRKKDYEGITKIA